MKRAFLDTQDGQISYLIDGQGDVSCCSTRRRSPLWSTKPSCPSFLNIIVLLQWTPRGMVIRINQAGPSASRIMQTASCVSWVVSISTGFFFWVTSRAPPLPLKWLS